jgi:carboxypeptidase C (cathepsin A)
MKNRNRILIALTLSLTLPFTLSLADETPEKEESAVPEVLHFESGHSVKVGGKTIKFTATAGTLEMKNAEGDPIAHFGYTAYVQKDVDKGTRPILFAYNGGPGSASLWLHMGILGPQRTVVEDTAFTSAGPFKRVNNMYSILDQADIVMIDPVGTGFSRPVGEAKGEDFWGVDKDIQSVSNFIARYVTDNGRWASPKYLLGESYGGIRSGGVAYTLLNGHNIALNGVILVSPFMDYAAGAAGLKTNMPYINFLSTFAATAWYHDVLPNKPADLGSFLKEVEAFVDDVYAPVLLKGSRASGEERLRVLAGLEQYTGIDAGYWDRANLRITESRFAKELLRDRKLTTGRIDSRFLGDSLQHNAESMTYDPFFPAVGPAFIATFNDYYRETLGVKTDRTYVTSAGVFNSWNWEHQQPDGGWSGKTPFANTAVDLAYAMTMNPKMRLLVQQGYFDLATPYGATDYFLDQMDISEAVRNNITVEYYEAGHMMYVHEPSLIKFKKDLADFINR